MFLRTVRKSGFLAAAFAVLLIITGIWLQFFYSRGFVRTTAIIVSIQEEGYDSDNDEMLYSAVVEYTVGGVTYTEKLDTHSSSYREGKTVKVLYDPENPSVVHDGDGMGLYILIGGILVLVVSALSGIRRRI